MCGCGSKQQHGQWRHEVVARLQKNNGEVWRGGGVSKWDSNLLGGGWALELTTSIGGTKSNAWRARWAWGSHGCVALLCFALGREVMLKQVCGLWCHWAIKKEHESAFASTGGSERERASKRYDEWGGGFVFAISQLLNQRKEGVQTHSHQSRQGGFQGVL